VNAHGVAPDDEEPGFNGAQGGKQIEEVGVHAFPGARPGGAPH
jgi:hypothetical protein